MKSNINNPLWSLPTAWCCLALVLGLAASALAGPYADSAHGDALAGGQRSSVSGTYAIGNCAHCHESHASVGGAEPSPNNAAPSSFGLFAPTFNQAKTTKPYLQADLFCFYCHTDSGSLQGAGLLTNHDYAETFGGTNGGPTSILEAFNQPAAGLEASYHNLEDVRSYAQRFSYFDPSSTPCEACHNSHRAKRNREYPQDPAYTAISRPTDHENLWGDAPAETMASYGGKYQAPFHNGSSTTYEPDGVAAVSADGSKSPDYNQFCNDCHFEPISSTSLGRNTVAIDWATGGGDIVTAGDKHGDNAFTDVGDTSAPYDNYAMFPGGYLLSCADCHEPHGSPNAFLIRRAVNGGALGATVGTAKGDIALGNLCRQCHPDDSATGGAVNSWEKTHHGGAGNTDFPYLTGAPANCVTCHEETPSPQPIGCGYCHFHGSFCDATNPGTLPNSKTIPAPVNGFTITF